jgi:tetratricopeptide (TPR) repeat protein
MLQQTGQLQRLGWALCGVYLILLSGISIWRNPAFASETRLWQAEVASNPKDFLGWQNLAESLSNSRRYVEADAAYRQMLALAPDYPGGLRARTSFLRGQGRHQEALQTASKALAIAQARSDFTAIAFDRVELAEVSLGLKAYDQALAHLDQVDPRMGVTTRYLEIRGKALAGLGRYQEAAATIERIVTIGKQSDIRFHYGLVLLNLNRLEEARRQIEEDVKLRNDAQAWNLLGAICAQLGDWAAAVSAFEQASILKPENAYYRENLARARGKLAGG